MRKQYAVPGIVPAEPRAPELWCTKEVHSGRAAARLRQWYIMIFFLNSWGSAVEYARICGVQGQAAEGADVTDDELLQDPRSRQAGFG